MEEGRSTFKIIIGRKESFKKKPSHRWRTIFEWILKKQASIPGIGLIQLKIGIIRKPLGMRH